MAGRPTDQGLDAPMRFRPQKGQTVEARGLQQKLGYKSLSEVVREALKIGLRQMAKISKAA